MTSASIKTTGFLTSSFFLLLSGTSAAIAQQAPPLEWGSISPADLRMTSYAGDTTLPAVILCDYGESNVNDDLGLTFTHHRRIKIFTPSGYAWAGSAVDVYTYHGLEGMDAIEGATYSLNNDGTILTTPMDDAAVFREEVDKHFTRYRFTLPALQPGCVVEYRYTLHQRSLFDMRTWSFQKELPVLWSEYRSRIPRRFAYTAATYEFVPFAVNEASQVRHLFSGETSSFLGSPYCWCNEYRWVVRNAPPLPDEPFVASREAYATRVDMQLSGYVQPSGEIEKVYRTWEKFISEFLDDEYFGGQLEPSGSLRRLAEAATRGEITPEGKMKALYRYVRDGFVWTGENRLYASANVEDLLESKKGNNAEITFLLIALLRSAGLEADPIVVSTRSHGRISDAYPIVSQFNYVLARAVVGTSEFFLDATDPLRPVDMVPTKVLNVRGLLVKDGQVQWVTVRSLTKYVHHAEARLSLKQEGGISGTLTAVEEGYGALAKRRDLKSKSVRDVARELFDTDRLTLNLDSAWTVGADSVEGPLMIHALISSTSYAQASGGYLYLNPSILDRQFSSPFTLPARKFPVDMSYPRELSDDVRWTIPEGYELREAPLNNEASVGRGDAAFSRTVSLEGRIVHLSKRLSINRVEFPPKIYPELMRFFERVAQLDAEQIVLQRSAEK